MGQEPEVLTDNIVNTTSFISITGRVKGDIQKLKAESLKLKKEAIKTEAETKKIESEEAINYLKFVKETEEKEKRFAISEKTSTAFQMMILSEVMSKTFNNSEYNPQRVFSDDDLLEYKKKMLELLKKL